MNPLLMIMHFKLFIMQKQLPQIFLQALQTNLLGIFRWLKGVCNYNIYKKMFIMEGSMTC